MKIVRTKFRRDLFHPIKEGQKDYYFICPMKDVEVGDALLVEYNTKRYKSIRRFNFLAIVRVDEVIEDKAFALVKKFQPTAYALINLGKYEKVDKRLIQSLEMRKKYNSTFRKYLNVELYEELVTIYHPDGNKKVLKWKK